MVMDKPNDQERSVKNKCNASTTGTPKVALELHLLPTDVLRDILSRLSLKQAVRMSMLSREWRRLGICHPDLVFTEDTVFGSNTTEYDNLESMAAEFVNGVDSALRPLWSTSTTTTTTVNKFVVSFGLDKHYTDHIDAWIRFCTASMAKHICVNLRGNGSEYDKYVVPLCKLSGINGSCIKSLDMASVCLKLPPNFGGITNLKKLSLHVVSIDASDLQSLLLSCALLESLSLERCPLSGFSICHELFQLQYLSVRECDAGMIQLQAPNLTTFEFDDRPTEIMLNESFKLSDATFVFRHSWYKRCCDELDYILNELPTSLHYVHKLCLNLVVEYKFQVHRFSKTHATFINLRHLNLNIDNIVNPEETTSWATGLVNLLEVAPLLQELELHIFCDKYCHLDRTVVTPVPGPLHRDLRSVHITGFSDFVGIAELALYILGNAIVLECMVVDPVVWMDYGYSYTGQFYSARKAGSCRELVRRSVTEEEMHGRMFAKNTLTERSSVTSSPSYE